MLRHEPVKWKTEAEMFASFQRWATAAGWVCYPETAGYDLVLVATAAVTDPGVEPGDTVAIEGKLRPNVEVLGQAAPPRVRRSWDAARPEPHFSAVLVPKCTPEFRDVAGLLGVSVIVWPDDPLPPSRRSPFQLLLLDRDPAAGGLPLPEVRVDMVAGHPSPRPVTRWKLAAVRLCLAALADPQHHIRRSDFVHAGVEPRLWLDRGWMERVGGTKPAVYRLLDAPGRPDRLYPEIVAALAAQEGTC